MKGARNENERNLGRLKFGQLFECVREKSWIDEAAWS